MANSILVNHPECHLFILLIDERPEEVTDMKAKVQGAGAEVISSTFDKEPRRAIVPSGRNAVLTRAKRLVETGTDVVILLDSLTRLAPSYATSSEPRRVRKITHRGLAAKCLGVAQAFLWSSSWHLEEGGSLTILATALVDTGSRMDKVIFEEFKGTGNMELHLDRHLARGAFGRPWTWLDPAREGKNCCCCPRICIESACCGRCSAIASRPRQWSC